MTDKFSKSYVLDRIAAREGSIDLQIATDQPILDAWKAKQVAELDAVLEDFEQKSARLADQVKKARKDYDKAEGYDAKRAILSKVDRHNDMRQLPWAGRTGGAGRSAGDIIESIAALNKEKVALIHAKVYLEGMPVDEFTLASLRNLGLLSVLKFRLEDQVAK